MQLDIIILRVIVVCLDVLSRCKALHGRASRDLKGYIGNKDQIIPMNADKPRILFLCGRELSYTRNRILHDALDSISTLTTIAEEEDHGSTIKRSFKLSLQAAKNLSKSSYDFIFIGFYGYIIFTLIKLLTRTPIIFDPFISNLDTLIYDRKLAGPGSVLAMMSSLFDRYAPKYALINLLDTNAHIAYFSQQFKIPEAKFRRIFVSCEDDLFYPRQNVPSNDEVLFYGSFLPIHGIDTIIKAARIVGDQDERTKFRIIGKGQEYDRIRSLAQQYQVNNVIFQPPIPLNQLPSVISKSKICLGGHFGPSDKAKRVIAGKTFQCIAMGKPTIVGSNLANAELLTHAKDAWFCEMDSPEELAKSILHLNRDSDLCSALGENAHRTFVEKASPAVIHQEMSELIKTLYRP